MRYYIDSGHLEDIKRLAASFPISGLTTNPDIIAREKTHPLDLYRQIHKEVPQIKEFHMQVCSKDAASMIREAQHMRKALTTGPDALPEDAFFVKIPVNKAGVEAMMHLIRDGVAVTATGVFTSAQCLIAGDLGASYVAPYITPITAGGLDGIEVVREAAEMFRRFGHTTKILGAGFSVESQVSRAALAGADVITMPALIYDKLVNVPQTDVFTDRFVGLFQAYAGEGKTLLDFE